MSGEGVEAVRALQADVLAVIRTLSEEEWQRPSHCSGWRVQDVVAHMGSGVRSLVDPPPPTLEGAPVVPAEQAMELLVAPRKGWASRQVLEP